MQQVELFGHEGDRSNDLHAEPRDRSNGLNSVKRARARKPDPAPGWALEDHICRHCMGGRLISKPAGTAAKTVYHCTNCGAEAVAETPAALCCCGLTVKRHGPSGGGLDVGLRCHRNTEPTPDFPSVIVASEREHDS